MNWKSKLFKLCLKYPFLSRFIRIHNDGFIKEDLKPEDYTLGASPLIKGVLQADGQWDEFLPTDERQSGRRIETMACTCFSCLNVLETLAKRKGLDK
jgi:hypothetical protein